MYQRLRRFHSIRSQTVILAPRCRPFHLTVSRQRLDRIHHPRIGKQDLELWLDSGQQLDCGSIQLAEDKFTTSTEVEKDQVLFRFPSSLTITAFDAESDPELGRLLEGKGEFVKLAIWLMKERSKDDKSRWFPFLKTLPTRSMSPILWLDHEIDEMLFGSPVLQEAKNRREALKDEWSNLDQIIDSNPTIFTPRNVFTFEAFLDAFSVVLASAFYLPSAGSFALLPAINEMKRTGNEDACELDYDVESDEIIISSNRNYNLGEEVCLFDDRPNGERLLTTGSLELDNPSDFLLLDFQLVPADRLFSAKRQILESMDYQTTEPFPIYQGRIPVQLLSFLRLSRIQDPGQLAQVNFDSDQEISQLNEYEVLQLVLGECRVRLSQYQENWESDVTALKNDTLTEQQRISRQLLLSEKRILQSCVDIVRTRLAPIRGIPTKSGKLEDPNQDLAEMFKSIEELPSAPKRALDEFLRWAKGEYDPEWGKKQKR